MIEAQKTRSKSVRSKIPLHWVISLLLIVLIFTPLISMYHRTSSPTILVETGETMSGTVGSSIISQTSLPVRNVTLYNNTFTDPAIDWLLYSDGRSSYMKSNLDEVLLSGLYSIRGSIYLPVVNYSYVKYSISMTCTLGSANISIRNRIFDFPYDSEYYEGIETSTPITAGSTEQLTLITPLDDLLNITPTWLLRSTTILKIDAQQDTEISFERLIIKAYSEVDLYPTTFNIQAPDGTDLFANPSFHILGNLVPYYSQLSNTYYPAFRLTMTGNMSDSSLLVSRSANETLYLTKGTYSGEVGWFRDRRDYGYNTQTISFTIGDNDLLSVNARIPVIRLYLDISPVFAHTSISLQSDYIIYWAKYPLPSTFFYIPPVSLLRVAIYPVYFESIEENSIFFNYDPAHASISIDTAGESSDLHVTVTFPHIELFGFILDLGQISALMIISILVLIVPIKIARKTYSDFLRNKNTQYSVICVALYYISAFTPWATYSYQLDIFPYMNIDAFVLVPFATTILTSRSGLTTPVPNDYLSFWPSIIIFFWFPFSYLQYLLLTRNEPLSLGSFRDRFGLIISLIGPLALGLFSLFQCLLGYGIPSIGLVAALAITPSWIIAWKLTQSSKDEPDISSEQAEIQLNA